MSFHRCLSLAAVFLSSVSMALGITVPVLRDSTSTRGKFPLAAHRAVSLASASNQTAYLKFRLRDPQTAVLTSGQVISATLRLYVISVKKPSQLIIYPAVAEWSETAAGAEPGYATEPTPPIIPAEDLAPKNYVQVDVTSYVQAALDAPNEDFGLVIVNPALSPARVLFASKEGVLPAPELNIEVNYAPASGGAVTATTISTSGDGTIGGNLNTVGLVSSATLAVSGNADISGKGSAHGFSNFGNLFVSSNSGFGTAATTYPVTVQSDGNGDLLRLFDTGGAKGFHLKLSNGGLNFVETGVAENRLLLAAGGNVGIGKVPIASARLDVSGSIFANDVLINGATASDPFESVATGLQGLRIAHGVFRTSDLSILSGSGFTVTRAQGVAGKYIVTFDQVFGDRPAVIVDHSVVSSPLIAATSSDTTIRQVVFTFRNTSGTITPPDIVSFVAVGLRKAR